MEDIQALALGAVAARLVKLEGYERKALSRWRRAFKMATTTQHVKLSDAPANPVKDGMDRVADLDTS